MRLCGVLRLSISMVLSSLLVAPAPTVAALTSTDTARLSNYERILFGDAKASGSTESRLQALEKNIFGKARSGTEAARLAAIGKLLGEQKPQLLSPPLAPKLAQPEVAPAPSGSVANSGSGSVVADYDGQPLAATASDAIKDLLRSAIQAYNAGNIAEAERLFERVLKKDADNGDANYNLGAIAESRGDLDAALKYYKRAYDSNPGDGDYKEAVASVSSRIQEQKVARAQAQAAEESQRREQAQAGRLRNLAGEAAEAYKNRDYDRAIQKLDQVAREAPSDAEVQFGLAQAWRGKGDYGRARFHIHQAVSMDSRNSLYRDTLASIEKESRESVVASSPEDYRPAGEITPFDDLPPGRSSRSSSDGLLGGLLGSGGGGGTSDYGYSYARSGSSSRIKRAAIGGLAGAAIGGFMGRNSDIGIKKGAIQGAIFGGLAGFFSGGF